MTLALIYFSIFYPSIQTKEININDENYKQLYQLSSKYGHDVSKSHIESNGVAKTYEISEEEDNEYYRYFRFLQKEDNRSGHRSILTISSIDFFGKIKKIL